MSWDRKAGSQLVEARAVYKVLMADKPYILQKESTFPFFVNLVSEYFWKGDVPKKPLLGSASAAVSDAGHLAVLVCGFVQALVTVHMLQGQLLKETGNKS